MLIELEGEKKKKQPLAIEEGHGQFFSNEKSAPFFIALEGMAPFIVEK